MRAWVVLDLGFGDAGKGLVTDALVRRTGATVVARFNGGAQAGHNVVAPDGRHHTFAQLGAGTFAGASTVLGPRVIVHPTALLEEILAFGYPSVLDKVTIDARAPIITPFHQALGRLRELSRGRARHGSCGVGVGEVVRDALANPDATILAGDLSRPVLLAEKAEAARNRLGEEARALHADGAVAERERAAFGDAGIVSRWIGAATPVAARVRPPGAVLDCLASAPTLVLEGAQGVLLDEDLGFHPYTTWARCTDAYANGWLAPLGAEMVRVGVARALGVRHGPGPLPTEDTALAGVMTDHNTPNAWQGPVRVGHFDAVLLRYALDVLGGVDHLVLTHLDATTRAPWTPCAAWDADGTRVDRLELPRGLADQEALTRLAERARPLLEAAAESASEDVTSRVTALIGAPVSGTSRGPMARDLRFDPGFFA